MFIIPITLRVRKWFAMSSYILKIAHIECIEESIHNLSKPSSLLCFYAYYYWKTLGH